MSEERKRPGLRAIAGGGAGGGRRHTAEGWDQQALVFTIISEIAADEAQRCRIEARAERERARLSALTEHDSSPVAPSPPAPGLLDEPETQEQLSLLPPLRDVAGLAALGRELAVQRRETIGAAIAQVERLEGPLSDAERGLLESEATACGVLAARESLVETLRQALWERRAQRDIP